MKDGVEDFPERERLLLLAAYLYPQQSADRITANCWRVLRQAMLWAGALDEQIEAIGGHGHHPVVEEWYRTLIEMARQEPAGDALLWVAGNLGSATDPPAWPAFTGCGLTEKGREFFERHREKILLRGIASAGLVEIRDMQVKIVNGLHAHFKQPSGPSRPGHDWIVAIIDESGERKLLARTYDDDAPQATPDQHARRALDYVIQSVNAGAIPAQQSQSPDLIIVPKAS